MMDRDNPLVSYDAQRPYFTRGISVITCVV